MKSSKLQRFLLLLFTVLNFVWPYKPYLNRISYHRILCKSFLAENILCNIMENFCSVMLFLEYLQFVIDIWPEKEIFQPYLMSAVAKILNYGQLVYDI